jgi:septum formation inhibitor MinC
VRRSSSARRRRTPREQRLRALEFEEALSRRQDDAQQEFLMLHNQAVAHAERITQDANEQVAASLEHAQRITAKADDFDKLMRAQAQQHEADARSRSREILDRASVKAQKIIDTVTGHSQSVLRDAEDRTRALRWQQQQLTSFMSEVKELLRTEAAAADSAEAAPAPDATTTRRRRSDARVIADR